MPFAWQTTATKHKLVYFKLIFLKYIFKIHCPNHSFKKFFEKLPRIATRICNKKWGFSFLKNRFDLDLTLATPSKVKLIRSLNRSFLNLKFLSKTNLGSKFFSKMHTFLDVQPIRNFWQALCTHARTHARTHIRVYICNIYLLK